MDRKRPAAIVLFILSTTAISACSTLKTVDLNTGAHEQQRSIAQVRTQARQRYHSSILASLPAGAKRKADVLDEQAVLLKQGLYLNGAGHVTALTPAQQKQVSLAPPPAKVIARVEAKRRRTTPVTLDVPKNQ